MVKFTEFHPDPSRTKAWHLRLQAMRMGLEALSSVIRRAQVQPLARNSMKRWTVFSSYIRSFPAGSMFLANQLFLSAALRRTIHN